MNTKLVEAVRRNMQEKPTEELTRIDKDHNKNEWSEEAFEAIRQVLIARGEDVPPVRPQSDVRENETTEREANLRPKEIETTVFEQSQADQDDDIGESDKVQSFDPSQYKPRQTHPRGNGGCSFSCPARTMGSRLVL